MVLRCIDFVALFCIFFFFASCWNSAERNTGLQEGFQLEEICSQAQHRERGLSQSHASESEPWLYMIISDYISVYMCKVQIQLLKRIFIHFTHANVQKEVYILVFNYDSSSGKIPTSRQACMDGMSI